MALWQAYDRVCDQSAQFVIMRRRHAHEGCRIAVATDATGAAPALPIAGDGPGIARALRGYLISTPASALANSSIWRSEPSLAQLHSTATARFCPGTRRIVV